MELKKFKGGSLSGTYLCNDGAKLFVRKEVSLTENREFGFYRWFSQLKKLQRLGRQFPDLFPEVLDIGIEGNKAYFDLAFIPNAVTVFEFLRGNPPREEIEIVFKTFVAAMDTIHAVKMRSFRGGFDLYIDQEVRRALEFCMDDEHFKNFAEHREIVFNGETIRSFLPRVSEFDALAKKHYTTPEECLTHGNITLENTLYCPKERKIIFVDLYEENFVDTVYNEYSQVLQSCNSYYEVYNELSATVEGNRVTLETQQHPALDDFNGLLGKLMENRFSESERIVTRLYEISQFTRMLPFKKAVAKDKMIFFYALASRLFDQLTRT